QTPFNVLEIPIEVFNHVAPRFEELSIKPLSPTAIPITSSKETLLKSPDTPLFTVFQLSPPFIVLIMVPLSPTATTLSGVIRETPRNVEVLLTDELRIVFQLEPELVDFITNEFPPPQTPV